MKVNKITPKDILTGVIIALVSIPISMGYAQVAGLPPVYGLYGSIFPILIFGLLSTSPQFIFGVDAAPAGLIGAFIAQMNIDSDEAVKTVPLITFFVGMWLLLFYLLKAGKTVNYISTPVMGGFISGISTSIIFMQIPKILGGTSGRGEIAELVKHIVITCRESFNAVSLLLGSVSLFVLLLSKKLFPKVPMSVPVMIGGALLGYSGFAEKYSVAVLPEISGGLPEWSLPDFKLGNITDILTVSFTVALVIMAETLLASNNFANKNGYKINNNHEILVYALGNFSACFTGCCAVNGSVSRTSMNEQYGGKTQAVSVSASFTMMIILLFFTGFIKYLPVPVLTAIVISALLGAVEFDLAERLYRHDKKELFIFCGAFFGVLVFGTVYGVMTGILLSFVSVIVNTANPKRSFLGVIKGRDGFHSLERNTYAVPLESTIIYRFSGNLYFANISTFVDDIEGAVKSDTKCVVVDSGAICSIDITSADRIKSLQRSLESKGIKFYFASHIGTLNDRFREIGMSDFVESGHCRRTIESALADAGFSTPYVTESSNLSEGSAVAGNPYRLEFEWAFGAMADDEFEKYAEKLVSGIDGRTDAEKQLGDIVHAKGVWESIGEPDQEEFLEHLQVHSRELSEKLHISEEKVGSAIEMRRIKLALRLQKKNPGALEVIIEHNKKFEESLREKNPELYTHFVAHRKDALENLRKEYPEYTEIIDSFYRSN